MAEGPTLRIDNLPLEDFFTILSQHERDVRIGYLPKPSFLKEVKLEFLWQGEALGAPVHITLYCMEETDPLSEITEAFVIMATRSEAARAVIPLSKKLRECLASIKEPSLFRVDPKYGIVHGSCVEPVDPSIRWDRPGVYTALYLTTDPSSPSLAVLEYVPPDQEKKFTQIFEKYNGVAPKKPSLLTSAWNRFTRKAPPSTETRTNKINYKLIRALSQFLQREHAMSATVSLIFKNIEPEDVPKLMVDPVFVVAAKSGNDRFFGTLSELT
ncbi:MAG TPA: hypothetical protein PK747_05025 [Acidobacteriota bacterium]|nr:hypothetical protein [Acidobacteriota bacterium]HNT17926.1 hypothetical protein [Acidobacteriota bacterium]HPA27482.1 hypothetical protein [Acidobacteriota bacterium]HQO18892.1 hypothetical protein [Acidobacteriota bacterium]HQQ46755.1 hypothetical protein [Acidobacteriota bacterium]